MNGPPEPAVASTGSARPPSPARHLALEIGVAARAWRSPDARLRACGKVLGAGRAPQPSRPGRAVRPWRCRRAAPQSAVACRVARRTRAAVVLVRQLLCRLARQAPSRSGQLSSPIRASTMRVAGKPPRHQPAVMHARAPVLSAVADADTTLGLTTEPGKRSLPWLRPDQRSSRRLHERGRQRPATHAA